MINKRSTYSQILSNCGEIVTHQEKQEVRRDCRDEPITVKLVGSVSKEKILGHNEVKVRGFWKRLIFLSVSLVGPLGPTLFGSDSAHWFRGSLRRLRASDGRVMKMLTHCRVARGLLSSTTELSASFPPEQCVSFIAWSVTIHVENEIPQSDLLGEIIQSYSLEDLAIFCGPQLRLTRTSPG